MCDSDEDWFDKDIDEFVVDVQESKVENISFGKESKVADKFLGGPSNVFFDSDYGGNYNKPQPSNNSKSNTETKSTDIDTRHIQPISYKKLSFILELTPLNIFLEILQPDSGFIETINRLTISREVIALTLKAIAKIIILPLNEHKKCFLKKIVEAKSYWKQIENYIKNSTVEQKTSKDKKKIIIPSNDTEFWENLILLCRNVVQYFKLEDMFIENAHKFIIGSKHEQKLSKFTEELIKIETTVKDEVLAKEIYPTLDELKATERVYVKPNIVKGQYPSITEYLNVQMSLFREDFISPLRDGIVEFRKSSANGIIKSNANVKVYPKVRILTKQKANTRSHKGEFLMVDLHPDSRDNNDSIKQSDSSYNYAKKFMYGSLVFFTTTDSFDDLILSVISNRDTDLLNQGYIQIEIVKIYNISMLFDRDFIMFESEVYFEPYHQVYRVLNNFNDNTFPMSNYIIDIDSTHSYPAYVPSGKKMYTHKKYNLDIKNTSTWPASHLLKLNDSQLDAMKHALTNKFSIIQGPPGTGKTYVGLEILSVLLKNTDEQILIICTTNHTLDQCLEGALNFTEDIVRMGNQSKCEKLDRFNVKQLTENVVSDKRMKNCFYKAKCEYAEWMEKFEELQTKIDGKTDRKSIEHKMLEIQQKLRSISRKQDELKQISEYNLLKSKRVIGMTTTCAARCTALLHLLKTPIVFVEEAAEILESHIVAALTLDTQHLILIGDHQQLRPTTSAYKLAKRFKMDISLFERMVNNGIHSTPLTVQHRMRPEIANLIRPAIYKELLDHDSVKLYPEILGVQKSVLFFNHTQPESKDANLSSKKNIFEAQFTVAFCNYLILQGYAPEDVTILTTYNSQIFLFSQERRKYPNLRKVRITVIDNFQGEESKIILLSLVRNNLEDKIGYLDLTNRICVLLSRAQEGFFMMGNIDLLSKNSKVWRKIQSELLEQNAITDELILKCQTHGNETKIKYPTDFEMVKFGGCQDTCSTFAPCGHQCSYFCHTNMFEHYSKCDCNK